MNAVINAVKKCRHEYTISRTARTNKERNRHLKLCDDIEHKLCLGKYNGEDVQEAIDEGFVVRGGMVQAYYVSLVNA